MTMDVLFFKTTSSILVCVVYSSSNEKSLALTVVCYDWVIAVSVGRALGGLASHVIMFRKTVLHNKVLNDNRYNITCL